MCEALQNEPFGGFQMLSQVRYDWTLKTDIDIYIYIIYIIYTYIYIYQDLQSDLLRSQNEVT